MFDILIQNGTVIDGRNVPRTQTNIAIQGDRIAVIGPLETAAAHHTIDAAGHVVAPGFIDVHTHSDGRLLKEPFLPTKVRQGYTTELLMLDGIAYAPVNAHTWRHWFYYLRPLNGLQLADYTGWESIADFMALLDGRTVPNVAAHIPYANVRTLACGFGRRQPDDYEMYEIKRQVQIGLETGAVGLSTGLDYVDQCWATTDELVAACRMMAGTGGLYVTHVRYALGTLAGLQEAIDVGRRAGVPVHVSHLKGTDTAEVEAILTYIDKVAVNEVDFSFDVYPYLPSSTMLQYLLPYDVWQGGPLSAIHYLREAEVRTRFNRALADLPLHDIQIAWVPGRANQRFLGQSLADYVTAVRRAPADALCDLLIEESMAVLLRFDLGDDDLVHPFLAHEKFILGSDGIYFADGHIHPRWHGAAARLLGPCVRDHKLFSLETAVHKLTGAPASRFGLQHRGVIQEGNFADLVIFDAERISDRATYDEPHRPSVGVKDVLVNGTPVVVDGRSAESLPRMPGRYLRFRQ